MLRTIYIGVLLFFWIGIAHAQINLEQTYNYSGTYTKLSQSGHKFYIMDVGNSQCRIYNPNHTLWKTINLSVPANHYLYDIKYVTENLFATDNTLSLAYTYYNYDEVNQYYTYTTKVVQENGTALLTMPGCAYVQVIQDQGLGTKLLAFVYDYSVFPYTVQTWVYNLPGNLVSVDESSQQSRHKTTKAYPNPASSFTTITYDLPSDNKTAEIRLFDLNGQPIKTAFLEPHSTYFTFPISSYPSGTYSYIIVSEGRQLSQGKFIVN